MPHLKAILFIPLSFFFAAGTGFAEEPFFDQSFNAALSKAANEEKVVLIEFFTTSSDPSKLLDQTTMKDPDVIQLLNQKAVALKIDAEEQRALSKKYRISAYPTLLMLNPDGTYRGRIVGYRDPKQFTSEFTSLLAKDGNDPKERSKRAKDLERNGMYAEALEEYLWCFDEGHKHSPAYRVVRFSLVLDDISRLGNDYPPAIKALEARRDARMEKLDYSSADVTQLIYLNSAIHQENRSLEILDKLPLNSEIRKQTAKKLVNQLIEKRRYAEALEVIDPEGSFNKSIEAAEKPPPYLLTIDQFNQHRKKYHKLAIDTGARYLEAIAGNKDTQRSIDFATQILGYDNSQPTIDLLLEHARSAANQQLIDFIEAQGNQLSGSP